MHEPASHSRKFFWLGWLCAACLLAVAFACDASVARWVHDSGLGAWMKDHALLRISLRAFGIFWYSFWIGPLLFFLHPQKIRAWALLWTADAFSAVNCLIKWLAGRTRPYRLPGDVPQPFYLQPFYGGFRALLRALLHPTEPSKLAGLDFPSGDATLAFATAGALAILLPRWRWYFYLAASIVAVERVAENAHYLSDVVAGAMLGILCALLARRLLQPRVQPLL